MGVRDTWIEKAFDRVGFGEWFSQHVADALRAPGPDHGGNDFVAQREKIEPELVRSEVGARRAIIPANINHKSLEPWASACIQMQDQLEHRHSATTSDIDEELKKLHHSVALRRGHGDGPLHRGDIPRFAKRLFRPRLCHRTVPIYEALSRVKRTRI